jgi:putative DNA base modification enzyme with NMAD domain
LAGRTANHQGTRLCEGDWIAGVLTKACGHRLLYVMEVAEVLDLNRYFNDPRSQRKKPDLRGDWKQRSAHQPTDLIVLVPCDWPCLNAQGFKVPAARSRRYRMPPDLKLMGPLGFEPRTKGL